MEIYQTQTWRMTKLIFSDLLSQSQYIFEYECLLHHKLKSFKNFILLEVTLLLYLCKKWKIPKFYIVLILVVSEKKIL